jgi:uncharacterized membrane protein
MPEIVRRPEDPLPPFPAGKGKGAIFSPMRQDTDKGTMRAHAVQTVLGAPEDLFRMWRNTALAPRWMEYVVSAEETSPGKAHWVLGDPEDPDGKRVEYDTTIEEEAGSRIAWKSVTEGVSESGEVTFEPAENGRGTIVTLRETAAVPGGKLGIATAAIAKRSPRQVVIEDLRHFKQMAEAGEIPNATRNPHGPRGFVGSIKHRLYGENNPTPVGTSDMAKD